MTTRIVLIRHGRTVWNREERFRGQTDIPLDNFGRQQAEATGRYVAARWPVVAVYASPLKRALQTAEAVARAQGLTMQPMAHLMDINFGAWQGKPAAEIALRYPEMFHAWRETPHTVHFPDGERLDDVRKRVIAALEEVTTRHTDQTIALVSHTVVIRVMLCVVLGWGNERFWRLRQGTCAVNLFEIDANGTFTIALLNDTGHLLHLVDETQ